MKFFITVAKFMVLIQGAELIFGKISKVSNLKVFLGISGTFGLALLNNPCSKLKNFLRF
jgi:hypothetical protein